MSDRELCFTGRVWCMGDYIDTDEILPAKYLNLTKPEELALHCMENLSPGFHAKVTGGDILVAGKNFGCGSSREHAPVAIVGCGIRCIIVESAARIFFRNAINIGLPVIELTSAGEIREGDTLKVDCTRGIIKNLTTGEEYKATPLPTFMQDILLSGGLVGHIEKRLQER